MLLLLLAADATLRTSRPRSPSVAGRRRPRQRHRRPAAYVCFARRRRRRPSGRLDAAWLTEPPRLASPPASRAREPQLRPSVSSPGRGRDPGRTATLLAAAAAAAVPGKNEQKTAPCQRSRGQLLREVLLVRVQHLVLGKWRVCPSRGLVADVTKGK